MPRPGFVHDIDGSSPPTLFWRGEQLTQEHLPMGSRVVYAPDPTAGIERPDAAVRRALDEPLDGEPLGALLRSGMKLTIAFDDLSQPTPPGRQPDPRQRVLEAVLDLAAGAGVDDVELIAAIGVRRRMHEHELRHLIGDRVYDSFAPKGLLRQHDADDASLMTTIGTVDTAAGQGISVAIDRRVTESDLLVYVGVTNAATRSAWRGLSVNLASIATVRTGHRTHLEPGQRAEHDAAIGALVAATTPVFQVETTLEANTVPPAFSFLHQREREWSPTEKGAFVVARTLGDAIPGRFTRRLSRRWQPPTILTGVFAGSPTAAFDAASSHVRRQSTVAIEGQSDIVTLGVPLTSPYTVNSVMNPVLMAAHALGRSLTLHTGTPVVRAGGAAIIHHPTIASFDPVHHPSYIDFFDHALDATTDVAELEKDHEQRFVDDEWFSHLYRTGNAHHGVHPFHAWYDTAAMRRHLGAVIVVGGDHAAVRRLGFKSASTFADALEMAGDVVGSTSPSLTHLHTPPTIVADVH